MSYPINQPITYTAVAATQGQPSNTFTYAWAFDDTTTANTASTNKTWTTIGNHLATVTATDTTTLGTAVATKTISCKDWTQLAWVSTGQKIIPSASANSGNNTGLQYVNLIVSGDLLINTMDYYTPLNAVVFNSSNMARNEYVGVFSTLLHEPYGSFILNSGPNAGSVLVYTRNGLSDANVNPNYGFFNPSNGSFVLSPNPFPAQGVYNDGASTIRGISAQLNNGDVFVLSTLSIYYSGGSWYGMSDRADCRIYHPISDTWSSIAQCPLPIAQYAFTLPSGNIFVARSSTYPAYIYNVASNTWSSVPTIPTYTTEGIDYISILKNGRVIVATNTSDAKEATWGEGDANWTIGASTIPPGGSTTLSVYQSMVVTDDDMVVSVGGVNNSGNNAFTVIHQPGSTWVQGAPLPETGAPAYTRRKSFVNGKVWGSWYTGTLYYLQWA